MSSGNREIIPLSEVTVTEHFNKKINIMGIVVEFSLPGIAKSRHPNRDYMTLLKIVDQSQQSPEFSVNIFTQKLEQLPAVKSYGDVIVLHRFKIGKFDIKDKDTGHSKAVANAVFDKEFSSFALLDVRSNDFNMYQVCGPFSLTSTQRNCITDLRNWWQNSRIPSGRSEYLIRRMGDIKPDDCPFDLVCKVLHVSKDDSSSWVLYLWDGTDAPLLPLDKNLVDEEENPLPLQVESTPLNLDICREYPIGTILRVMANEVCVNLTLQFHGVGKWLRIRNIKVKPSEGMWRGEWDKTSSRVRFLADTDVDVVDRMREAEKIKSDYAQRSSSPSSATANDFTELEIQNLKYGTLADILSIDKDAAGRSIFYCFVRLVAICHSERKEFCSLEVTETSYLRLTLEDSTARMHVYLCGREEQVRFFGGFSSDILERKMKRILGVHEHQDLYATGNMIRSPPLINCAIDPFFSDPDEKMYYYLCHTRLK